MSQSTEVVDIGLQGVNLYLVGMMGSGKSTTGQALATQLGYRFLDTDLLIEQLVGQSVSEIFAQAGEAEFRRWETQVLAEVSAYPRLVVATGGGIILNSLNWSYLHHGIVVWLNVPVPTLLDRLLNDSTRPLLASSPQAQERQQRLETLFSQRQHLYAQADININIAPEDDTQGVVSKILAAIPPVLKPREAH